MTEHGATRYAELHAHSNFSFLDGASHPEELVKEAARLSLDGLCLCDHDGLYGAVRFAEAARVHGVRTIFGVEITLGFPDRKGVPADPRGEHLVVLAKGKTGYARLSRAISLAQLAGGEKNRPCFSLEDLSELAGGHFFVLTGCRKGTVPLALTRKGPAVARRSLDVLIEVFGRDNLAVELWRDDGPLDDARNDALAEIALSRQIEPVATSNAHYASSAGHHLAAALAAIRARRSLDEMDGWLPAGPSAHLRSGPEQMRRFSRYPGVVERAAEIADALAFDLQLLAPGLPPFPVPQNLSEMTYLRQLVEHDAPTRYGTRTHETVPGAWAQLDHELAVIESLGFPGYFLVVWDITRFCKEHDIFCQGRGSAANSAVCYALGITNVDAVRLGLLFERFLSSARDGPPDIDIDIESGRREEVIQYVYERHGRHHAAQVANVITYRPRSAIRDAAKALGHSQGEVDTWSRQIERRSPMEAVRNGHGAGIPASVVELATRLEGFPRHLGVHSGGMVICDRPIIEVCPVEWARAEGRTVLQWDKEDCAAIGLVKFDLLGLGMLEALHRCIDLIEDFHHVTIDLATIPQEADVYEMLCSADTVGVFQVESRAQMGTLPRLRPKIFYDLVIEVALIRPGPIQGGSVHPYLRRRNHEEEVTYLHPILEPTLKKTLGVPLFQEQLMQMAIDAAGFSPMEADQLRQAMSAKRSSERMEALRERFFGGMKENEITGAAAEEIFSKMAAFANFGFPESHAASFAYLVYASAWLKLRYPAAFLAALLNSQPMGFWAPRTLIQDARRHGVEVHRPEVNKSSVNASVEKGAGGSSEVRLGLVSIRNISEKTAGRIARNAPYRDLEDLARRCELTRTELEMLATAGATRSLDKGERRRALWAAGALGGLSVGHLQGTAVGADAPDLPPMSLPEEIVADLYSTGVSVDSSLTELVREDLRRRGVLRSSDLKDVPDGARVTVAGVVTHRQRPETARGITFINLEDETGLVNVVCSVGLWARHRKVAQSAAAMIIRGRIESASGVVNIVAEKIEELTLAATTTARDFS